jgi:hypothetical protein
MDISLAFDNHYGFFVAWVVYAKRVFGHGLLLPVPKYALSVPRIKKAAIGQ